MRRILVPILWLMVMPVDAAPVRDVGIAGRVMPSSTPDSVLEVPRASSVGGDDERIRRRLRAIIEELKRQGPPPVGCMEG